MEKNEQLKKNNVEISSNNSHNHKHIRNSSVAGRNGDRWEGLHDGINIREEETVECSQSVKTRKCRKCINRVNGEQKCGNRRQGESSCRQSSWTKPNRNSSTVARNLKKDRKVQQLYRGIAKFTYPTEELADRKIHYDNARATSDRVRMKPRNQEAHLAIVRHLSQQNLATTRPKRWRRKPCE